MRGLVYIFCILIESRPKGKHKNHLKSALKDIYKYDRHIKCLVYNPGGQNFSCAAEAVRELKAECPGIELCIVMPFLPLEDEYLEVLDKKTEGLCDSVIIPDAWLEETGIYSQIQRVITERLVCQSDMLIIDAPIVTGFLGRIVKLANDMGVKVHNLYFDSLNSSEQDGEF